MAGGMGGGMAGGMGAMSGMVSDTRIKPKCGCVTLTTKHVCCCCCCFSCFSCSSRFQFFFFFPNFFFFFFFCRCRICSENLAGLDGQEQKFRRDGAQSMGGGAMGGGAMGGLGGGVAPDSSRPLARPRNPMNKRQYGYFHFF